MNKLSRTKNITRNVTVVFITQVLLLIFGFINRTIFIRLLGEDYLGLDGLFYSILTIFSLAELGIGNALIFSLYKPIATGNIARAQQLFTLYNKAYKCIIAFILLLGFLLVPFLKSLINTDLEELNINIYTVFFLFLFNTVSSYFLAYRQAILVVNQMQSTVSLYQMVAKLTVYILECFVLLYFASYYIYLIIRVVGNYIVAILLSRKAKSQYPELCINNNERLPANEIKVIKENIIALFLRRIGGVVLASTDNIVINSYISLAMVGIYSNYVLIVSSIQTITSQMMSAMTASIGNFVATETQESAENAFKLYSFLTYLIYGVCSICFVLLVNRFIMLLWGDSYVLSKLTLYLIVLNFFFYGYQSSINVFRDTTGLFVQGKYRSLISAMVNIIASIILVKPLGIEGVVLGTIVSRVLISAWYDPYILYKYYFNKSVSSYFTMFLIYLGCTFFIAYILDLFTDSIDNSIIGFIKCSVISAGSTILLLLPFVKTAVFNELKNRIVLIVKK